MLQTRSLLVTRCRRVRGDRFGSRHGILVVALTLPRQLSPKLLWRRCVHPVVRHGVRGRWIPHHGEVGLARGRRVYLGQGVAVVWHGCLDHGLLLVDYLRLRPVRGLEDDRLPDSIALMSLDTSTDKESKVDDSTRITMLAGRGARRERRRRTGEVP